MYVSMYSSIHLKHSLVLKMLINWDHLGYKWVQGDFQKLF